jgi:Flp pilus assembly protein TadB
MMHTACEERDASQLQDTRRSQNAAIQTRSCPSRSAIAQSEFTGSRRGASMVQSLTIYSRGNQTRPGLHIRYFAPLTFSLTVIVVPFKVRDRIRRQRESNFLSRFG